MQHTIARFHAMLEQKFEGHQYGEHPKELYEPINYIMSLGGKRLRPILVMLGYSLFKDDAETIIDQAMAVEVFHNFTLMHDDIMDEAPIRRGKATVHEKWNHNTAILSGDVMLVKAYELLLGTPKKQLKPVLHLFNKTACEVCEGQQLDMEFETRKKVTEEEYLEMIRLKTAVLLGMSLEFGAILAEASKEDVKALRVFGENIGVGFQLKDDLLDVYADKEKFGKQVGGDILSNKKTYLLINAIEKSKGKQKTELNKWLNAEMFKPEEKVAAVTGIYNDLGIKELTETKMNHYFETAFSQLKKVNCSLPQRAKLKEFAEALIDRQK
ncbi:MAG: polyprenyl synthetase family protein [Fulvivirga sp.]|uniref:polyprenyl synthetase family protein n=1 Tax=Fulvivirga sp. TaxID=1931237 RepID=UPI0032EF9406